LDKSPPVTTGLGTTGVTALELEEETLLIPPDAAVTVNV
jgi:hypothetical protein